MFAADATGYGYRIDPEMSGVLTRAMASEHACSGTTGRLMRKGRFGSRSSSDNECCWTLRSERGGELKQKPAVAAEEFLIYPGRTHLNKDSFMLRTHAVRQTRN